MNKEELDALRSKFIYDCHLFAEALRIDAKELLYLMGQCFIIIGWQCQVTEAEIVDMMNAQLETLARLQKMAKQDPTTKEVKETL